MIKVKIKKVHEDAKLPTQGKPGDFCYDVWAVSEEEIAPNVWRYKLGFKYEIDRNSSPDFFVSEIDHYIGISTVKNFWDLFNISIDFRPRSSIYQTGMSLSNCEGTLDEFYRGEAQAIFYHVMPNMPRYKAGDKIGQIKIGIAPKVEFEFVDEINENTERGDGGFGSTGKK